MFVRLPDMADDVALPASLAGRPGLPSGIRLRPSARVVLLDGDDRLLMLQIHDPYANRGPNPITEDFWLLVGGGVEPGETYEQAARREVGEETGIDDVTIGRCVWTQEKVVEWITGLHLVVTRFFVGRVPTGTPVDFARHEPLEAATTVGYRWFTLPEILEREQHETFLPPGLGTLLGDVLRGTTAAPISLTDPAQIRVDLRP